MKNFKIVFLLAVVPTIIIILLFFFFGSSDLQGEFRDYVGKSSVKDISIYVEELETKKIYAVNENKTYLAASLFKVPILMAYLHQIQDGEVSFSSKLTFGLEDAEFLDVPQYPEVKNKMVLYRDYTVEDLLGRMIRESDNNATEVLMNNLPIEEFYRVTGSVGLKGNLPINSDLGAHIKLVSAISPKNYAKILKGLYEPSYLNIEMAKKGIDFLSESLYNDGLKQGVPENIKLAHKFGNKMGNSKVLNFSAYVFSDCGIVYTENPYLICVMASGEDFPSLEKVIADISKITYKALN